MRETPDFLSDRLPNLESGLDVLGDILDAMHLTTAVFGQVGYANPVAFTKAFSRLQRVGPGAFCRARRQPNGSSVAI